MENYSWKWELLFFIVLPDSIAAENISVYILVNKLIIKFGIYVEEPKSKIQFSMKFGTNIKIIKKSIKFNTFFNINKGILLILLYFIKIKKWHKDCKINN